MSTQAKNYSILAFLIALTKFLLLSAALIYVDRFNSDMIENLYWGQEWQWGYYKHPPFFAWVAQAWVTLFNNNLYYYHILTALTFSLSNYLSFMLFKKIIDQKKALLGMILIDAIVYSNFVNICFNANTLLLILHPIIGLFAYNTCQKEKNNFYDWIWFGIFSGLALLTKYSSGLVILGCALFIVYIKKWKFLKEKGFYCGFIVCLAIISLHIDWMLKNDNLTLHYLQNSQAQDKNFFLSRFYYTKELLEAVVLNFLPFIIAILFIIKKPFLNVIKITHKNSVFMLLLSIIPFFLMTLIGGIKIKSQWLISHVFLVPACFLWFINIELTKKRLIACISVAIVFFIGFGIFIALIYKKNPNFKENIYNIPISIQRDSYEKLSRIIHDKWKQKYGNNPKYICGNNYVGGAISMFSRNYSKLHVIADCNLYISRWINGNNLLHEGMIGVYVEKNNNDIKVSLEKASHSPDLKAYQIFDKADEIHEIIVGDSNDQKVFVYFYKGIK